MPSFSFVRVLLSAIFLVLSCPAFAGPEHGIAMHGEPRQPAGFSHPSYVNPAAPKGGILRHGAPGTFDSLNPFIIRGKPALGLNLTYDTLMARVWDEPFSLYGLVAESIETPDDRSWVAFALRPEARFHDGSPVTVDDVIFSFESLKTQGRPNARRVYGLVAKVERLGERGVRFTFGPGFDREMALILAMMPVLPKSYWAGRDFSQTTLEPPLGGGPYRIAAVDPGRSLTYERVPDHWAAKLPVNVGSYNFDTIRYDYYRDDGIALEAFKAGTYDFRRESDPTKWASGYDVPAAREGRIRMDRLQHGRPEWLRALIFNTRRPVFQDRRVRQAFDLAFDFEWMNKALFHGAYARIASYYPNSELAAAGVPTDGERAVLEPFRSVLPPEVFGPAYAPPATDGSGPAGLRRNLLRAAELLSEAGWATKDGRRVNKAGEALAFEILLNDPSDEKVALEFSRALKRIGVEARVRSVDSAQYTGRLEDFDFDMTLNRWVTTLSPGNEQVFYWGSQFADQKGSRNYAGIRSPAVDAIAASLGDTRDRETLLTRIHALDRVLTWGNYIVPLYYLPADHVAYWNHLRRPAVTPVWGNILETWWAEPNG